MIERLRVRWHVHWAGFLALVTYFSHQAAEGSESVEDCVVSVAEGCGFAEEKRWSSPHEDRAVWWSLVVEVGSISASASVEDPVDVWKKRKVQVFF